MFSCRCDRGELAVSVIDGQRFVLFPDTGLGCRLLLDDVCDVGDHDGGDDAAVGRADDPDLRRGRQKSPKAGNADRLDVGFYLGLSFDVDRLQLSGDGSPMAIGQSGITFTEHGCQQFQTRRRAFDRRRDLSVASGQGQLPAALPVAVSFYFEPLASGKLGCLLDGDLSWDLLHRLLLGLDALIVRRRGDEYFMDRAHHRLCFTGKNPAAGRQRRKMHRNTDGDNRRGYAFALKLNKVTSCVPKISS